MQRLLRVSMATGRCGYEPLPDYLLGLGGRGLASAIVARATEAAEPLALEAMLVFAPGLLAGTHCANAGRMSVCFKSPVTGLLHEANAGGVAGVHMARLGIAGLVLEGRTANNTLLQLEITRDSVRLMPTGVQGLGTLDAATVLANRHGARCSCILIGTAGEMGLTAAGIAFTDRRQRPARHAGSGGGGAVMGALGLKAVVIIPPETDDQPMRDAAAFSRAARRFAKALMAYHGSIPGQGGAGDCARCISAALPLPRAKTANPASGPAMKPSGVCMGVRRMTILPLSPGLANCATMRGWTLLKRPGVLRSCSGLESWNVGMRERRWSWWRKSGAERQRGGCLARARVPWPWRAAWQCRTERRGSGKRWKARWRIA